MTRAWYWYTVRWSNRLCGPNLSQRVPLIGKLLHAYVWLSERLGPSRRKQIQFEKENPESPWWAPDSIPYIEALLKPEMHVFEWGSGRSTLWLAARVKTVVTVEHDSAWLDWVANQAYAKGVRERIVFRWSMNHAMDYAGMIDGCPDELIDLVVVDGAYRTDCLAHGWKKLKDGGILILDNAERPDLKAWRTRHEKHLLRVFGSKIQETAIYWKVR